MKFFWFKKDKQDTAKQIADVKKEILQSIEDANKNTARVNVLLDKDGGIAEVVFYATGGNKRGN